MTITVNLNLNTDDIPEGVTNLFFTEPRVRSTPLTGLNVAGGSIASTDTLIVAMGKIQNQINGVLGGAIYQGTWNATTNSPALASGVGTKGYYYVVSVAGSTNLNGVTDWKVGDWAIFNGIAWEKVDNTDAVSSVNGYIGAVNLVTTDIAEGSNLYYTDARARAAITGTSNRVTVTDGVVDISANYVGQSSITTLGTITTGTWSATAIAADKGGTGQTVYAVGDLLYASTTTALSKLADVAVGSVLISGGVGVAPSYSANPQLTSLGLGTAASFASGNVIHASFTYGGAGGYRQRNSDVGPASYSHFVLENSGAAGVMTTGVNGTGNSLGGVFGTASLAYTGSTTAPGVAVVASNAAGQIFFYTGGSAAANLAGSITSAGVWTILPGGTLREGGWNSTIDIQASASEPFPAVIFGNQTSSTRFSAIMWTRSTSGNTTTGKQAQISGYESGNVGIFDINVNNNAGTSSPTTMVKVFGTLGVYVGGAVNPSAVLHLRAGTTAASSAPLKFTSGSLLTTAEAGAVEFLTDKFYGTITTGAARKEFIQGDNAITDAVNIVFGTTTGTKIGTAAAQKIGFWNAAPIVQPASANQAALSLVDDVSGPDTADVANINFNFDAIKTLVNQLRADLVSAGLIKGSA